MSAAAVAELEDPLRTIESLSDSLASFLVASPDSAFSQSFLHVFGGRESFLAVVRARDYTHLARLLLEFAVGQTQTPALEYEELELPSETSCKGPRLRNSIEEYITAGACKETKDSEQVSSQAKEESILPVAAMEKKGRPGCGHRKNPSSLRELEKAKKALDTSLKDVCPQKRGSIRSYMFEFQLRNSGSNTSRNEKPRFRSCVQHVPGFFDPSIQYGGKSMFAPNR